MAVCSPGSRRPLPTGLTKLRGRVAQSVDQSRHENSPRRNHKPGHSAWPLPRAQTQG
jgi:hypothetical protein